MGWGMAWPYLPNYIRLLGGDMLFVALLSVLFNLFSSFGQYFWGRKSDALQRRKPFIITGLLFSGLFFLVMGLVQNAVAVLTLRAFQGFFAAAQTPAISALVSELSENVGRGFGIFNMFSNAGFMLGNFISGYILNYLSINYVFVLSVIPLFFAFFIVLFFKEDVKEPKDFRFLFRYDRPGRTVFSINKSREFLKKNKNILIFTVSIFVLMLSAGMVYSYLSLLLSSRFGNNFVGYYYGIDGLFSAFLIYPFGYLTDRYGSKVIVVYGTLMYIVTFVMYAISTTMPMILITALISGSKWASYFNSINVYTARMSSHNERATALGVMNSGIAAGWVIGPLLGAYIVMLFGLANMMLIATIPVALSLIILVAKTKNDRGYEDGRKIN